MPPWPRRLRWQFSTNLTKFCPAGNPGFGQNERRVLPKAEKSIIRHAHNGLFSGPKAADCLKYDAA